VQIDILKLMNREQRKFVKMPVSSKVSISTKSNRR